MRNRTADLLLTMETLCLLSYRGAQMPRDGGTNGPRYTLRRGQGESAYWRVSATQEGMRGAPRNMVKGHRSEQEREMVTSTAPAPIDIVRS